jgi:hypothetical protein
MIICTNNCSIFNRCKKRVPEAVCFYDLGLPEDKEEDLGDIIEKLTY